jgi:hypothetical protein
MMMAHSFRRLRQEDYLNAGAHDQAGQHWEIPFQSTHMQAMEAHTYTPSYFGSRNERTMV